MKQLCFLVIFLVLPSVLCIEGLKISVFADDELMIGTTYDKLFKLENLDHVSGETSCINVSVSYNISDIDDTFEITCLNKYKYAKTGEIILKERGNYTLCGWIISSSIDDPNLEDNIACKNITFIGQSSNVTESSEPESYIKIKKAPNEAKFGEIIDVEIEVYKGDTQKYAVYAKVNNVGEKTTIHLKGKYSTYDIKLPLQIKPNCNGKYDEGEYDIVVEGLDVSDEEEIYISGFDDDMCKVDEIIINETIVINETKTEVIKEECPSEEKLFDISRIKCNADLLNSRVVYESSSEKAYKLVPIMIIAVLILLLTVLVWKR